MGALTIRESPSHKCAGVSTRRIRETCWVASGLRFEGLSHCVEVLLVGWNLRRMSIRWRADSQLGVT